MKLFFQILFLFVCVATIAIRAQAVDRPVSECEEKLLIATKNFANAAVLADEIETSGLSFVLPQGAAEVHLYYSAIHYLRAHKIKFERQNIERTLKILADSKSENPIVRLATTLSQSSGSKRAVRGASVFFSAKELSLSGTRAAYEFSRHEILLGANTFLDMQVGDSFLHEIAHAFIATLLSAKVDSGFLGEFTALPKENAEQTLPLLDIPQILGTGYKDFLSISELYAYGKGVLALAAQSKALERKLRLNPNDSEVQAELYELRSMLATRADSAATISQTLWRLADIALKHFDRVEVATEYVTVAQQPLEFQAVVLEVRDQNFAFKLNIPMVDPIQDRHYSDIQFKAKQFLVRRLSLLSRSARQIESRFLALREAAETELDISQTSAALNNAIAPLIELK